MKQSDEKTAKILKRKALNKKILKYGCLPIGGFYLLVTIIIVIASSDQEESEQANIIEANPLIELIGISIDDSLALSYGVYDEIPCSSWPERFRVYTYQDVPISFVVDFNSGRIVEADSAELKACNFVDRIRLSIIRMQFDSNGHHKSLMNLVKNSMHDPSSFEPAETRYAEFTEDGEIGLFVYMKYRGNNAFGSKVVNEIGVTANSDGTILDIFQGEDLPWAIRKYSAQ